MYQDSSRMEVADFAQPSSHEMSFVTCVKLVLYRNRLYDECVHATVHIHVLEVT